MSLCPTCTLHRRSCPIDPIQPVTSCREYRPMTQILKYEPQPDDTLLPRGARILHLGLQDGQPRVWVEGDPEAPLERRLVCVGTGQRVPTGKYVGTIVGIEGKYVFHFYDIGGDHG